MIWYKRDTSSLLLSFFVIKFLLKKIAILTDGQYRRSGCKLPMLYVLIITQIIIQQRRDLLPKKWNGRGRNRRITPLQEREVYRRYEHRKYEKP